MKPLIVILANCQGNPLLYMLNKYYSSLYDFKCYANYEYINNNLDLPSEIKNADIFLYQNYSNNSDKYNIKNILDTKLKDTCIKICFPSLHSCGLLFCYDFNQPKNNHQTTSKDKPFGEFFFGISCVNDEVEKYNCDENSYSKEYILQKVIEKTKDDNFINETQILYYNKRTFDFLENKCLTSDIPEIYDFIKNNFSKTRLWHNPNHPTGILLNEMIKLIFLKLKLNYYENEENYIVLDKCLSDWVMPIFPCVKKYYNLEFDTNICSSWYHKKIIDIPSYIEEYLLKLYFTTDKIIQ